MKITFSQAANSLACHLNLIRNNLGMTPTERLLVAAGKLADDANSGPDWDAVIKASGVAPAVAEILQLSRLVNGVERPGELRPYVSVRYGGRWQLTLSGQNEARRLIHAERMRPKPIALKPIRAKPLPRPLQ